MQGLADILSDDKPSNNHQTFSFPLNRLNREGKAVCVNDIWKFPRGFYLDLFHHFHGFFVFICTNRGFIFLPKLVDTTASVPYKTLFFVNIDLNGQVLPTLSILNFFFSQCN